MSAVQQPVDPSQAGEHTKKRRTARACDLCRHRKTRCDGEELPGNRCTTCINSGVRCTRDDTIDHVSWKKANTVPSKGYVESLEKRLEKMEKLFRQLHPDENLTREIDESGEISSSFASTTGPTPVRDLAYPSPAPSLLYDEVLLPRDEDFSHETLITDPDIALTELPSRFYGKSSDFLLAQKALEMKRGLADDGSTVLPPMRRSEFWSVRPWEAPASGSRPQYNFPDEILMASLIDLYFTKIGHTWPVLHEPSFRRSVSEHLHLRDLDFAGILLVVLSLGSKYSNDPRVFLDETSSTNSCGWKWFTQVKKVQRDPWEIPKVYELQIIALSIVYRVSASTPEAGWTLLTAGVRLAQSVGIHRRKAPGHKPTQEDELWKRAFWALIGFDKFMCAFLGRPRVTHDDDLDLEYPIDCDDEYWDAEPPFQQPAGKPSRMAFSIHMLKLYEILGTVLRTIYSINKSKLAMGYVGADWEQEIVAQLDSALNNWSDSVPDHLRWDPHREDTIFFNQSATLYASYYHIQILIHRPFIPSPRNPSPLTFPSLSICANAARSCCHVVSIQTSRGFYPLPHIQIAAFTAGIILLLNIWSAKKSGMSIHAEKEMADVHKCMTILKICEGRFHPAGRFWDILYGLATMGDLPLPSSSNEYRKHSRESSCNSGPAQAESPFSSSSHAGSGSGPRNIAGSRRAKFAQQLASQQFFDSQQTELHPQLELPSVPLPMYSDELGRLPLHGNFNFTSASQSVSTITDSLLPPTDATTGLVNVHPNYIVDVPGVGSVYTADSLNTSFLMDQSLYDEMDNIFASFESPADGLSGGYSYTPPDWS